MERTGKKPLPGDGDERGIKTCYIQPDQWSPCDSDCVNNSGYNNLMAVQTS